MIGSQWKLVPNIAILIKSIVDNNHSAEFQYQCVYEVHHTGLNQTNHNADSHICYYVEMEACTTYIYNIYILKKQKTAGYFSIRKREKGNK